MRAVLSSLVIAVLLAVAYLAYDLALLRGADLPGGDLRLLALVVYAAAVLAVGTVVTYLVVPQPTGSGTVRRRSAWSAALGFFAAVPIAWLVMVVTLQLIRPMLATPGELPPAKDEKRWAFEMKWDGVRAVV